MQETQRAELTRRAEEVAARRAGATAELKTIAVELWRDGLHNVRQIATTTTLSRATVYAALRAEGIEPTQRTTEQ
ncbi:hypothetical protein ACFYXD_35365 [Streptomyces platensis]|uniref:hypothetical protein n=1 Tax=Streptomyces platensis TaxID=58346 RepID=UPI0036A0E3F4